MALSEGTKIGPYEVIGLIGQGGMGEVWQARDTKLDRDVALKVLPEAFTSDPDRLARFEREAKVLASLNHPNIGSIYGLEEAEGVKALVLELVEGPTLADRIKQGPIPIDEALPIAKQIAEALEAAHEQGVIHRDLKPANIKVKADGTVKVLDFGLAKAFQPDAGDPGLSASPTISLTAAATQMGMVIGTAAYMAPEQAKGLPVDKRADIWAYGAVLFEMLTGKKLFDAGDVSEMLASVLVKDPDISSIGSDVPAHIRSVVRQCLVKDPKERLRDIGDVRLAMKRTFETTVSAPSEPATSPQLRLWQRPVPALLVVLLVAVIAGLAVWSLMRPAAPAVRSPVRFTVGLPASDELYFNDLRASLALATDGETLVYVAIRDGRRQLYRRPFGQLEAIPIAGTEDATNPFFSPDGAWIGFEVGGVLKRIAVTGGPTATLYEGALGATDASWGTNDVIVFGLSTDRNPLMQVASTGGVAEPVTTLAEGESDHRQPALLPGGTALLFAVASDSESNIAVKSLETGERRLLFSGSSPRYVASGHIVFARENALWAAPFEADTLNITGDPVPVLEGVAIGATGYAHFTVAENGSLAYVPGVGAAGGTRSLLWVDREGREEVLSDLSAADYRSVDVSPDGSRLALELVDEDGSDVWIYDLTRGTLNPLTTNPAEDQTPRWTPDGRQVVFGSDRDGSWGLYRRNADGTGEAERLTTDGDMQNVVANTWTPEGDTLVVMRRSNGRNDLMLLSMEDEPALELLLDSEFQETRAAVSPDGDWIAYSSNRSGRTEIYVERFPDLGGRQLISTDAGFQPRWSPDGRELFYAGALGNRLMVVSITTEAGFSAGTPEIFAEGELYGYRGRTSYAVMPDGQRLVAIRRGADGSQNAVSPGITVVQNWFEELKARVPVP